jgi:hypothetical protein
VDALKKFCADRDRCRDKHRERVIIDRQYFFNCMG